MRIVFVLVGMVALAACSQSAARARTPNVPAATPATTITTFTTTPSTTTTTTTPQPPQVEQAAFTGRDTAWVVVDANRLLHTSDAGVHWTDATPRGATDLIAGLYAFDDERVWVASNTTAQNACSMTIYRTRDAGAHWNSNVVPGCDAQRFFFRDSLHGWDESSEGAASGQEADDVLQTSDGGAHWQVMSRSRSLDGQRAGTSGALDTDCDKSGIAFANASLGIATGTCANGYLFARTTDAGRTWDRLNIPLPNGITTAGVQNSTFQPEVLTPTFVGSFGAVLVVNNLSNPASYLYTTNNGGRAWSVQTLPIPTVNTIDVTDTRRMWISGGTALLRSTDGGAHWTAVRTNLGSQLRELHFVSDRIGWAFIEGGGLARTIDGGHNWATITPFS